MRLNSIHVFGNFLRFCSDSYDNQILLLQWKKSNAYLEDPNDANFDIQLFDVEPTEKYSRINIEEKFDYYRRKI